MKNLRSVKLGTLALFMALVWSAAAREYHVSPGGKDTNDGAPSAMLQSISAAAELAKPGDVITVHAGIYRERIDPPRGGSSDDQRITYRAAPGEQVVIKGSEIVKGWEKVQDDTWKVEIPNTFWGDFNPFRDVIHGDWFNGKGRVHHTGSVYLNGHWLTEAARKADVMEPAGKNPLWFTDGGGSDAGSYLLNVAWLKLGEERVPASAYAAQRGVQKAGCSEGGQCVGWIEDGDWVRYNKVDFAKGTEQVSLRVASDAGGGRVEFRLDAPDGPLLGTAQVQGTGDWQKWVWVEAAIKPTSGVQTLCLVFKAHGEDKDTTTIWAQLPGVKDPNEKGIEINARQAVFYPAKTGINYLTIRGFTLEHAATPWAPPTAEQVGLIGTHWSKGWIIEDNTIRYSTCVGVTLGKHGDEFDNTSANSAVGYVKTIERGLAQGWSKANIGSHIVRNNHISHCEQAGIVGSLGPVFCEVTGNEIHDIHVRRLFTGAEMGGIKFHGAVDTLIKGNLIYRCSRGIWLDWMSQGTHVTRNVLYDNGPSEDLFSEVNHGPLLVDHNLLLSRNSILVNAQGGAYAHNLICGRIRVIRGERRLTPFLEPHGCKVAGIIPNPSGDEHYFNNLLTGAGTGLHEYDKAGLAMHCAGNRYLGAARISRHEAQPQQDPDARFSPQIKRDEQGAHLSFNWDAKEDPAEKRVLVTTETLKRPHSVDQAYTLVDGSAVRMERDFHGKARNPDNPAPGPFEVSKPGTYTLRVWPLATE